MATRLLTSEEVAELLRMTQRGLWNWIREGKGPRSALIGGKRLYDADEVEAFIRESFEASA